MIINIHLNLSDSAMGRFDTLMAPSSTIATLLFIQKKLGFTDIVGIDEAYPGAERSRRKIDELIEKDIKKGSTPTLLFSVLLYNSERTIALIAELRQKYGHQIKIIVGGQLAPHAKDAYLSNSNIDSVCAGDAEAIFPVMFSDLERGSLQPYYELWLKESGNCKFAGASYDEFFCIMERMGAQKENPPYLSQLTIPGASGPGCAWAIANRKGACSFCALQNIRTPNQTGLEEHLINELEIEKKFSPDRFFDISNQFIPAIVPDEKIKWLEEYIRSRKKLGIKAKKYAYLAVSSVADVPAGEKNDVIAKLLQNAGIDEVFLGIDHFHEEALKEENKSYRHRQVIQGCLDALASQGICFRFGLVLGSAQETPATLAAAREGVQWAIRRYGSGPLKAVGIFPVELYPGSRDWETMKASGSCERIFEKFDKLGYLSRYDQLEMTVNWIEEHSQVPVRDIYSLKKELISYLGKKGIIGY